VKVSAMNLYICHLRCISSSYATSLHVDYYINMHIISVQIINLKMPTTRVIIAAQRRNELILACALIFRCSM